MSDESTRLMNRFVRPIYDAIDSRQYKVALKHCAHKKVAHLDLVLVLKAHCLERTGKVDDALTIVRAVQLRKPTDETLLNTMNLVFKLAGCEHEMLATFEHACAAIEPPNEELYASLFFAYARRGAFLQQQQTALKMFKAFGGVKYMSWAALSMTMQVEHGGAPAKMLALAERMQLKTLRDLASTDGEALQLLVRILQLQDKHVEALSAFDELAPPVSTETTGDSRTSPSRAAEGDGVYEEDIALGPMLALDRLVLEASLAKRVGAFDRASRVYAELLMHHSADDWTFLTEYVDTRFALDDDVAAVESYVCAFLDDLESRDGNAKLRGPRLARIHVTSASLTRLQATTAHVSSDIVAAAETQLADLVVSYMDRFVTKTCCFSDLQQYLALFARDSKVVSASTRMQLVDRIAAMAAASVSVATREDESDREQALAKLHRRLLALKTLRFLGHFDDAQTFPVSALEAVVDTLVSEYAATAWLNLGATGGQREVQNTDDLLLLAAHFLLDAYQRAAAAAADSINSVSPQQQRRLLLRAAALLEHGLAHSAYNFQMKLLLARVYAYVGAGAAMLQRHTELDVKHVQLDSLSFLVLDKLVQLAHFAEARRLIDSIARMHRGTANDTPEYIARAYKTGVYSKAADMTQFLHARMRKSHTLAIATGEALVLSLFDALGAGPARLHDHVASSAFAASVRDLDALLAHGTGLSRNQHREVVVRWTAAPTVPSGDTFARDGELLVECDRSATFETSLQWLALRATAGKLLHGAAVGDAPDALDALAQQYAAQVVEVVPADTPTRTLQQQVWHWSVSAVRAAIAVIAAAAGDARGLAAAPDAFAEAQTQLAGIAQAFPDALVARGSESSAAVALAPYGVATLSLLLGECGLWTLCLLSAALRVAGRKKSRKDDAFAAATAALRAQLKQLHELFATLEGQVSALAFGDADADIDDASSSNFNFAAAERKVAANVRASYVTVQSRITQLLRDRMTFLKAK